MFDSKLEILLTAKDLSGQAFATAQGHVKRLDKQILGLAGSFGILAGGAGVAGVFAAIDKFVEKASDLNETMSKSDQIFGGQVAADIAKWGETAAYSLGLSQQAAVDAVGTMGNMFVQLGAGSDQAAKLSTNMVKLSADLASFHNVAGGSAEVSAAMQSAFRGEYDALQRYIPTINAAAVKSQALADTHKKNADELTDLEKAIAAVEIITRDAGAATDDFARTSDGLANQQRIAQAQLADLSAEIGKTFIPLATDAIKYTNEWIKTNKDWVVSVSKFTAEGIGGFAQLADQLFNVKRSYREAGEAWQDFLDAASGRGARLRGPQVPDDIYGLSSKNTNAEIDAEFYRYFKEIDAETSKLWNKQLKEDAKAAKELEQQINALNKSIAASNADPWDPIGYDLDKGGIDDVAAEIQKMLQARNNALVTTDDEYRRIVDAMPDTYDVDWDGFVDDAKEAMDIIDKMSQRTSEAIEQNFSDFLFDVVERKFSSLSDYLDALTTSINRAASDIAGQAFKEFIFNAHGNIYPSRSIGAYENMVTNKPTFFRFASGAGVFGESGYEGIMPLTRMPNGNLGVEAKASGQVPVVIINPVNESGVDLDVHPVIVQQTAEKVVANMMIKKRYTSRSFRNNMGLR